MKNMLEANLCCNNPKIDSLAVYWGMKRKQTEEKCLDLCPLLTLADFCYKFHSALPHTTYYYQDDNQNCIRLIRRFVYDVFCFNILYFIIGNQRKKPYEWNCASFSSFFFVGETPLFLQKRSNLCLYFWVDTPKLKQKPTEFQSECIVNCELLMHACIAL